MGKFFEKVALHPEMVVHTMAQAMIQGNKATRKGDYQLAAKFYTQARRLKKLEVSKAKRTKNIYKKAADEKTYPISRAYTTLGSVQSFGASRAMMGRALQGRKNIGQRGITSSEREVMKKIKKETSGKTYPASRFATNPAAMGGLTAAAMTPYFAFGKKVGVGAVAYGALAGAGGAALYRGISARALRGRTQKGRVGTLPTDKRILRQLKNNA